MLYFIIAAAHVIIMSGCVFFLLIGADKYTKLEKPWVYILCSIFWPVAALPAAAYILAGWYINREEVADDGQGQDEG